MSTRGLGFTLARISLELSSPLTIASGSDDDFVDTPCVVSADGLPAIPGTSLAGLMRHLAAEVDPASDEVCVRSFGFQDLNEGDASSIEVSWAHAHDASDCPTPLLGARVGDDPVLQELAAGVTRDHVRLNGYGTVDGRGKFDVHSVPAGARFSFELCIHDDSELQLEGILRILVGPRARLGSASRRGLGRFRIIRVAARRFDLRDREARADFARVPRALHLPVDERVLPPLDWSRAAGGGDTGSTFRARLELEPEDFWLLGGGHSAGIAQLVDGAAGMQIVPMTEKRILWNRNQGTVSEAELVLPASSLKGCLRHRTTFHARRLGQQWALESPQGSAVNSTPEEVVELFGALKARVPTADGAEVGPEASHETSVHGAREDAPVRSSGQVGRVFVDDVRLSLDGAQSDRPRIRPLDHVSIDRFSGGPIDGALFQEAPVLGPKRLGTNILLDFTQGTPSLRALQALRCALEDLCEGRLALGTGSNRGHGYFRGQLSWEGEAPWGTDTEEEVA